MKELFRNPLFLLGFVIKCVFLGTSGSEYLNGLFIPFLDQAVVHAGSNPWTLLDPHYFPYASVMFGVLFPVKWLCYQVFGEAALGLHWLSFFSVKFPLLVFDFTLLFALIKWVPTYSSRILLYYWLNPVCFYISFIHGQLDVIPMAFCFLAVATMARDSIKSSAVLLAAATLCKFHVAVLIPLFLIYIWNRNFRSSAFKSIAAWIGLYTSIVLVGFLPLIFARHLDYSTVSSPEALRLFAGQIPLGDGRALFIGVLAVAFALGRLCLSTRLTPNGLLMGAGVVMSSLICFTDVAPGWFYWPLPFFALFMSLYLTAPRTLYWSLLGAFFIYYVALANFPALNIPFLSNLIFTFQQFCLVSMTFVVLYLDLKFSAPMFGRIQPVQIGIAGDSGTGKNSVILTFQKIFGDAFTLVVEGDDYHRWERGADQWHQITHLDPKANLLKKLHSDARLIRRGISAFQPQYNHETGRFTTSRERRPVKTVFYQGLHTFYYPSLRSQLDVRIFLRPDENLRLFWKIRRDSQERGHSVEKIVSDLARREEDSRIHIAPQAHYADWIIRIKIEQDLSIERLLSGEPFTLIAEYKLRNEPALIDLLDLLRNCGAIEILSEETTSNLESMSVVFKGSPTADTIREIAEKWFAPIRHISRSNKSPIFSSGLDGIHQLFLLALLQLKREMENA